jgi:hypothetical protein
MIKRLVLTAALFSVAAVARADSFNLNTSSDLGNKSFGTVKLTQGTNEVTVEVDLNSPYSFRTPSDSNHTGFDFDLSGISGTATISNISSNTSTGEIFHGNNAGGYKNNPYGSFEYEVICTDCGAGAQGGFVTEITFDVNLAGILTSDFSSVSADLVNTSNSKTGSVTGTFSATPPSAAPEPSSLMLLGTGALGLAGAVRRKFRRA